MSPPDKTPESPAGRSAESKDITRPLDPDYEAILAAVTETARGRWFLDEYARRNRTADTRTLLGALNRLQKSLDRLPPPEPELPSGLVADLQARLSDVSDLIGRTRIEIAAVPRYGEDGAVRRTAADVDFLTESEAGRTAVRQAHESAERIQEVVWNLRERNVSPELCDVLDRHAVDIQAACRDGTATLKGMDAMGRGLRLLETGIAAIAAKLAEMPAEPEAEAVPDDQARDIFADDPALGRFIEDIEIIEVEDVEWYASAVEPDDEPDAGLDAGLDDGTDVYEPSELEQAAADLSGTPHAAESSADSDDLAFLDDDEASDPLPQPESYVTPLGDSEESIFVDVTETNGDGTDEAAIPETAMVDVPSADPPAGPEPVEPPSAGQGAPESVGPVAAETTGSVTAMPDQSSAGAEKRDLPPADLTGLTFDQKMILFS